jgi:hypothetical protein
MYIIMQYYDEVCGWNWDGYAVSTALGPIVRVLEKAVCVTDFVSSVTGRFEKSWVFGFMGKCLQFSLGLLELSWPWILRQYSPRIPLWCHGSITFKRVVHSCELDWSILRSLRIMRFCFRVLNLLFCDYMIYFKLQLGCHPVAVHIYTQTIYRTTQITTEQHK